MPRRGRYDDIITPFTGVVPDLTQPQPVGAVVRNASDGLLYVSTSQNASRPGYARVGEDPSATRGFSIRHLPLMPGTAPGPGGEKGERMAQWYIDVPTDINTLYIHVKHLEDFSVLDDVFVNIRFSFKTFGDVPFALMVHDRRHGFERYLAQVANVVPALAHEAQREIWALVAALKTKWRTDERADMIAVIADRCEDAGGKRPYLEYAPVVGRLDLGIAAATGTTLRIFVQGLPWEVEASATLYVDEYQG